jgi:hypothetical protein
MNILWWYPSKPVAGFSEPAYINRLFSDIVVFLKIVVATILFSGLV